MSRCFPYPPQGYVLSRRSGETLIEEIELQNGTKKGKEERKKGGKGREKKEKRKEKKDEINSKLDESHALMCLSDEKVWMEKKDEFLPKGREAEIEQMEIRKEHKQPICLDGTGHQCSSPGSTENRHMRKRHSSQLHDTRSHRLIIRLKLPPKKKDDEPNTPASELPLCPKSGATATVFHGRNKDDDDDGLRDEREKLCCTLEGGGKTGISSVPSLVMNSTHRATLGYTNLIENWSPPLQHNACVVPDLDWLFQSRNHNLQAEQRRNSKNSRMSCSSSSALWPRAQYLKDVELYALPFTVPF